MKIIKKAAAAALAAALLPAVPVWAAGKTLISRDGEIYLVQNGREEKYTGFTDSAGDRKYYKNGVRVTGWCRLGEKYIYLRRAGGLAKGLYEIGNTFYEFDENGFYTGKSFTPEEYGSKDFIEPRGAGRSAYLRILGRVLLSAEENLYSDDYCGACWDWKKERYIIILSDFKNIEEYKKIAGNTDKLIFAGGEFSYNYLSSLQKDIFADSEKAHELEISTAGRNSGVNRITVTTADRTKTDALTEYILSLGYDRESFNVIYGGYPIPC